MAMDIPPLPPPPEDMMDAEESAEPQAGGTLDAVMDALGMVSDPDFLAALDDAGKLTVTVDVDSGDITLAAGDSELTVPAHLMGGGKGPDSSTPPPAA